MCVSRSNLRFISPLSQYHVSVNSLYAQSKGREAADLVQVILAQLGCTFPSKFTRGIVGISGIMKIATSVDKMTAKLEALPPMQDEEKEWAMFLLERFMSFTFMFDVSLIPVAIKRALEWTLKYGISNMTSPVLAVVALILGGSLGDLAGAKKYADLALKYMTPSVEARTCFFCYQFSLHYQVPAWDCIKALEKSCATGLRQGDTESGLWSMYCALEAKMYCGDNLQKFAKACASCCGLFQAHKQQLMIWSLWPVAQLGVNLADPSSNRHVLDGDIMEESKLLEIIAKDQPQNLRQFHRIKVAALFWFEEYQAAFDLMEKNAYHTFAMEKLTPGANGSGQLYFHCAMSCIALSHESQDKKLCKKLKQRAKTFLKRLSGRVNKGDPNVQHYESLIQAELASLKEKPFVVAAKHYDCTILLADQKGFLNDLSLTYERYGDHCVRYGDIGQARDLYTKAIASYEKWGALAKVEMVRVVVARLSE